jgi:hypothetical protein
MPPNKSPEPTGVGAFSLFHKIQVCHDSVRPWLSFYVRPREVFEIFRSWLAGGDFWQFGFR